jgi:hypothetical protein
MDRITKINPFIIFAILLVLISCNLERARMEKKLKKDIHLFEKNKVVFNNLIDKLKGANLLLSTLTQDNLELSELNEEQQSLVKELRIKEISYGRHITCDAMTDDSREMFFHLSDKVAIWYCPCIEQSEKDHFHDNSKLRGYKDLIEFYSIGLGGNWAIAQIKSPAIFKHSRTF